MKVLQIIDGTNFGGITKLMLDIEKNISSTIEFVYVTQSSILNNNNVYNINSNRKTIKGKIVYNYRLYKYLKENNFDIIHINSAVFLFSFQVALIARLCGIKKIIAHSHNTIKISKLKKRIISLLRPIYNRLISIKLTCSKSASKSLFVEKDNIELIKNGINTNTYKYNEKIRKEYRHKLNVDNKKVYGHIGRFNQQKNHKFIIELFNEIVKKEPESVLLLIGTGDLLENIKNKVKKLNIEDKVMFLGFKEDTYNYLNCMDIFLFPSLYEGLGISIIESQTSGLPTIVSPIIPEEANISNLFYRVNDYEIKSWINTLSNIIIRNRSDAYKFTKKRGYDIKEVSKKLEKIYKDLIK